MSSSRATEPTARRPRWRQLDSLFLRLLLVQLLLVAGLSALVGGVVYVERHRHLAHVFAERWSAPLAAAAGLTPAATPHKRLVLGQTPPPGARRLWAWSPRMLALRDALGERGVPLDELRIQGARLPGGPTLWLHLTPVGQPACWVGVRGPVAPPATTLRTLWAFGLAALLLAGFSWWFTRRLTQPLAQLQQRIQGHRPGAAPAPEGRDAPLTGPPELTAIAQAYSDLLARFEQHERERAVLLAGVSHDLRSPLGRIRMATALMPEDPGLQARKASIVRSVNEADRLIESFLDYVRSGTLELDESVDLAAVAREVVARFELPARQLQLIAPDQLLRHACHGLLIERVMANLIDNALKHGLPPVLVRLQAQADGEIWLQVIDQGPGVSPDTVGAMQEAFTRGDTSRSRPGSGLGLAIVRQVLRRLGGRLDMAPAQAGSEPPGWICTLRLPAQP